MATHLLPKAIRKHFFSVYAFCRGVDDLGDEYSGDRSNALDEWERQVGLCFAGTPTHPYFIALQQTIEKFDIPQSLFLKLLEANRMDQTVRRHKTYGELLQYCDHSANPVGRMVLHLFGHREEQFQTLSDATCTALQLANFWQDVRRDYAMGRIYIPAEDMEAFGVEERTIAAGRSTPEFARLLAFEVQRTHALFREGARLIEMVSSEARLDVALFTLGGLAVLNAIERQRYDVLSSRPVVSKSRKARLLLGAWARTRLGMQPVPAAAFR